MGLFLVWCIWLRDCTNIVHARVPELQSRHSSTSFCRWLRMHPGILSCFLVFSVWPTTGPGLWIACSFFSASSSLAEATEPATTWYLALQSWSWARTDAWSWDQSLPGTEGSSEQAFHLSQQKHEVSVTQALAHVWLCTGTFCGIWAVSRRQQNLLWEMEDWRGGGGRLCVTCGRLTSGAQWCKLGLLLRLLP